MMKKLCIKFKNVLYSITPIGHGECIKYKWYEGFVYYDFPRMELHKSVIPINVIIRIFRYLKYGK